MLMTIFLFDQIFFKFNFITLHVFINPFSMHMAIPARRHDVTHLLRRPYAIYSTMIVKSLLIWLSQRIYYHWYGPYLQALTLNLILGNSFFIYTLIMHCFSLLEVASLLMQTKNQDFCWPDGFDLFYNHQSPRYSGIVNARAIFTAVF